jgi:hypothetical protein
VRARFLIAAMAFLVLGFGPHPGETDAGSAPACPSAAHSEWLPQEHAVARASSAGYEVRRSKIHNGCYEVLAVRDGRMFGLYFNPGDLRLVHAFSR